MADFIQALNLERIMGIKDCAQESNSHQLLRKIPITQILPQIKKENLVFVTHSTGGIVAEYMLEAWSDTFSRK